MMRPRVSSKKRIFGMIAVRSSGEKIIRYPYWLGDSKPNFPAQASGFLYAQFCATPVKGTRFGIFARGECPRWRHRIVADLVLSGRAPRSCSKNAGIDSGLHSFLVWP